MILHPTSLKMNFRTCEVCEVQKPVLLFARGSGICKVCNHRRSYGIHQEHTIRGLSIRRIIRSGG